jgi:hypothetical protein
MRYSIIQSIILAIRLASLCQCKQALNIIWRLHHDFFVVFHEYMPYTCYNYVPHGIYYSIISSIVYMQPIEYVRQLLYNVQYLHTMTPR